MKPRTAQELHPRFQEAFNAGNIDGVLALYEPDAMLVAEPGRPVTGHAAIREAYTNFFTSRPNITVETLAVFEKDGIALLHGRWTMNGTGPDGSPFTMQGRNSEVGRRQADGNWLFFIDNPFTPEG
jgi:uncharacterized protein (TIGR02246 family)